MGHLIEEYAKSLGTKIGKPVIIDHFYPILDDKYITIHSDNKIDSKNYEYFPQVINLLRPHLQKYGYKIYQIGGAQDPMLKNVDGHFLNLSFKQSSYVLKNSSLHIGIDSLPIHMASLHDIPIVALYSHIYPSNAYPYWSSKDKIILLEADRKNFKPSFSYQESPKSIRTIKPEEIAKSALSLLNIKEEINFETIKIGTNFHIPLLELVPNFRGNLEDQKNNTIYIRADLHFDDQIIAYWCANYKSVIITDKEIPIPLLMQFSKNIEHVFFKLSNTEISNEYFKSVKNTKVKFTICSKNEDELPLLRNKFFDFKVDFDNVDKRCSSVEKIDSFFMTNKILISNGALYSSEWHLKNEKTLDSGPQKSYDDPSFWKDVEHFYFYDNRESRSEV